jgi:dienelactone hydrolase
MWRSIAVAIVGVSVCITTAAQQVPVVQQIDEATLRQYAGVYQWSSDAFVYLQLWTEFTGTPQLVAFDESGDVRTLYAIGRDRFFAGPGAALATAVESNVQFTRDAAGAIVAITWQRGSARPRVGTRVDIERHEDVSFDNGGVHLAGTLISPVRGSRHPAIVLVHGSGPQTRDWMVPFARFLVRHGVALLGYDKRGAGQSTGDWHTATFDDLAGDAVAALAYLRTRADINGAIGLMGVSQAGWIMPLAAVRAPFAFLISVSGAGVPAAETTIDHATREMAFSGMPQPTIDRILDLMRLQYHFAETGDGWNEYLAARQQLVERMGPAPESMPGTPDAPWFDAIRHTYFYDPQPTLRRLHIPILALFGALDDNILPDKNRAAWDTALRAGGNRDYTLTILPRANHEQFEAKVGNNAEMVSLQRFVPEYAATINAWLAKRVKGYR